MFKKYRRLLFFSVIFIFLLFSANSIFALETRYPQVPGLPAVTDGSGLGDYVGYFFGLGMLLAAIIAVISFSIGAIQYTMSFSSPDMENNGKDRMKGSILGLILTVSAFMILQTINPKLVAPTLTPLPGVAGVFYTNGSNEKAAPVSESNVANVPQGYQRIKYKCTNNGIAPTLLVWRFPQANFQDAEGYPGTSIERISCGGETSVGNGSFKTAFETPGVYYFLGEGCSGYMSEANLATQNEIADPFAGKIKSVKIVNGPPNDYYGVVFHNEKGATNAGDCTEPLITVTNSSCENLSNISHSSDFSAFSADIFTWNYDDPASSGDGVVLYNEPDGWNANKQSGQAGITSDEIGDYLKMNAEEIEFNYSGVDSEMAVICSMYPACTDNNAANYADCCACATFQDCSGSMQLKGSYLAAFYTYYEDADNNLRLFCQTFKEDAPNLSLEGFLPPGNKKLEYINIIPVK